MKRHNPTRAEKEALTDYFLKNGSVERLPDKYKGWPEADVGACKERATLIRKTSHVVHRSQFHTVSGRVGDGA